MIVIGIQATNGDALLPLLQSPVDDAVIGAVVPVQMVDATVCIRQCKWDYFLAALAAIRARKCFSF